MNLNRRPNLVRGRHALQVARGTPALSAAHGRAWTRMATLHPALP